MARTRVLIVSAVGDWSAEQVAQRLDARGIARSWLDPADFPQQVRAAARLGSGWQGWVETPHGGFRWEEVSSVFYRRPRDFVMPDGMSEPEKRFARAQARVGLGGVLASLPARWINHPSALADCEYKPWQLDLAATVGLRVPATVVTNDPGEVRAFAAEVGEMIVKPLAEPIVSEAGGQKVVWTRRITPSELADLAGVELTMHLFQQWIPKACDLRLTVVGSQVFPGAIHAHSEAAKVDWRTDYDALTYEVIDCHHRLPRVPGPSSRRPDSPMGRSTSPSPRTPMSSSSWNATPPASGGGSPRSATCPSPRQSPTC